MLSFLGAASRTIGRTSFSSRQLGIFRWNGNSFVRSHSKSFT